MKEPGYVLKNITAICILSFNQTTVSNPAKLNKFTLTKPIPQQPSLAEAIMLFPCT